VPREGLGGWRRRLFTRRHGGCRQQGRQENSNRKRCRHILTKNCRTTRWFWHVVRIEDTRLCGASRFLAQKSDLERAILTVGFNFKAKKIHKNRIETHFKFALSNKA